MALDQDKNTQIHPPLTDGNTTDPSTDPDRRKFLKRTGLATMAAMVGANIPFYGNMPKGLV
ncbi:MAG: twin-arginine translocation signal domain-containing protein, partial [Paracoccaceae bacterium]